MSLERQDFCVNNCCKTISLAAVLEYCPNPGKALYQLFSTTQSEQKRKPSMTDRQMNECLVGLINMQINECPDGQVSGITNV